MKCKFLVVSMLFDPEKGRNIGRACLSHVYDSAEQAMAVCEEVNRYIGKGNELTYVKIVSPGWYVAHMAEILEEVRYTLSLFSRDNCSKHCGEIELYRIGHLDREDVERVIAHCSE